MRIRILQFCLNISGEGEIGCIILYSTGFCSQREKKIIFDESKYEFLCILIYLLRLRIYYYYYYFLGSVALAFW